MHAWANTCGLGGRAEASSMSVSTERLSSMAGRARRRRHTFGPITGIEREDAARHVREERPRARRPWLTTQRPELIVATQDHQRDVGMGEVVERSNRR
jgi:hypothetical protein